VQPRVATLADLDGVTETLWQAFRDDPIWCWAFPDHAQLRPWWRFLIESALRRYPWTWVLDDYAAAAVWIPPGGSELTEAEEERAEPLLRDLTGSRYPDVIELVERFGSSHPREQPHYYLSLLGVHPDHRGRGLGMRLLADNLRVIDAEGAPAYLESSNPANDERYRGVGFERRGEFSTPDGAHQLATMWRAAR
jgi:GNAT superfamily N-acetyltransferase